MPLVLVVDDDLAALEVVSRALRGAGFGVLTAASGRDALEILQLQPCDVVLSELGLPDSSGLDLLRHLRRQPYGIPFIVMTRYATVQSAVQAFRLGAADYVEKPVIGEVLLQAVRSAVRAARAAPPSNLESPSRMAHTLPDDSPDMRIQEIMRLIESRLAAPVQIRELAPMVGLGPSRLRHLFRRVVGKSPSRWRRERRLDRAAAMLVHTHKRISEIAFEVGFSDAGYFEHLLSEPCRKSADAIGNC